MRIRKNKSALVTLSWLWGLGTLLFLSSCSGFSATGGPAPLVKRHLTTWSHPSFYVKARTVNQIVVMPLEGDVFRALPEDFRTQLSRELARSFDVRTSMDILNLSEPERVSAADSKVGQGPQAARAVRLGEELDVQGVLYGILTKLDTSGGIEQGIGQPSSVSFRLWLVSGDSPAPMWMASYEKTEQSLSDNIFQLPQVMKEGVRFRSSMQLLRAGFNEAAVELQKLRTTPLQAR